MLSFYSATNLVTILADRREIPFVYVDDAIVAEVSLKLTLASHKNAGISIESGARNNLVGSGESRASNLVSGNWGAGIRIHDTSSVDNVVQGNFIGTDVSGTDEIGNGTNATHAGVSIINATNNEIGGVSASQRNVISGNRGSGGILIDGATASNNLVQGNFIGTNEAGTAALANIAGVTIRQGAANTIGGTAAGAGNVISGNFNAGIIVEDQAASENRILGNHIGPNPAGLEAVNTISSVAIGAAPPCGPCSERTFQNGDFFITELSTGGRRGWFR